MPEDRPPTVRVEDAGVELLASTDRAVARPFVPGGEVDGTPRSTLMIRRVLAASDEDVAEEAARLRARFGRRHADLLALARDHLALVDPELPIDGWDDDRVLVLGLAFTAELAVEGAALCNPSAVGHPDQSGLGPGERRLIISLRAIAEPHLSSIQFAEAVVGPGRRWRFEDRATPLVLPGVEGGRIAGSPWSTGGTDAGESASTDYRVTFTAESRVSARVLLPVASDERAGMEDARFVEITDPDSRREYRGTYTAWDGERIVAGLMITDDFRRFAVTRLRGEVAGSKGIALFPRRIAGRHHAISRADGETLAVITSTDGITWGPETPAYAPDAMWEVVQSGNCGPPLETADGWLLLTHGVGPMRVYSLGAILLDLDDPTRVIKVLDGPLLEPPAESAAGYVPHVVYSCGGVIHEDRLWIPYGVSDARIRVASVDVAELIGAMRTV